MENILKVFSEGLLQFTSGTGLWTLIIFGLMLLTLWKFAWGPIINGLDNRANKIKSDINEAEKAKLDAEKLKQEAQKKLDDATDEAYRIISKSNLQANEQRNEIIEKAHKDISDMKTRAKADIEMDKKKAVAEMKQEAIGLAVVIASKLVRKILTREAHAELIEGFIKDYENKS